MMAAILPLLYVERGDQMVFVIQSIILLFSGVYYDPTILPEWMQFVGQFSPGTYVLEGIRGGPDRWQAGDRAAGERLAAGDHGRRAHPARRLGLRRRGALREAHRQAEEGGLMQTERNVFLLDAMTSTDAAARRPRSRPRLPALRAARPTWPRWSGSPTRNGPPIGSASAVSVASRRPWFRTHPTQFDPARDMRHRRARWTVVASANATWIDTNDGVREYRSRCWVDPRGPAPRDRRGLLRRNEALARELRGRTTTRPAAGLRWAAPTRASGRRSRVRAGRLRPVRWFSDMERSADRRSARDPAAAGRARGAAGVAPDGPAIWRADHEAFRDHWGGSTNRRRAPTLDRSRPTSSRSCGRGLGRRRGRRRRHQRDVRRGESGARHPARLARQRSSRGGRGGAAGWPGRSSFVRSTSCATRGLDDRRAGRGRRQPVGRATGCTSRPASA